MTGLELVIHGVMDLGLTALVIRAVRAEVRALRREVGNQRDELAALGRRVQRIAPERAVTVR